MELELCEPTGIAIYIGMLTVNSLWHLWNAIIVPSLRLDDVPEQVRHLAARIGNAQYCSNGGKWSDRLPVNGSGY